MKNLNLDGGLFLQNKQELKKQYNIYKLIAGIVGTCFLSVSTIYEDIVLKYEINSLNLIFICIILLCLDYSIYWMKKRILASKRRKRSFKRKWNNFQQYNNYKKKPSIKSNNYFKYEEINFLKEKDQKIEVEYIEYKDSITKDGKINNNPSTKKLEKEFNTHTKIGEFVEVKDKNGNTISHEFRSRFITHADNRGNILLDKENSSYLSKVEKIEGFKSREDGNNYVESTKISSPRIFKNEEKTSESLENIYGSPRNNSIFDENSRIEIDSVDGNF